MSQTVCLLKCKSLSTLQNSMWSKQKVQRKDHLVSLPFLVRSFSSTAWATFLSSLLAHTKLSRGHAVFTLTGHSSSKITALESSPLFNWWHLYLSCNSTLVRLSKNTYKVSTACLGSRIHFELKNKVNNYIVLLVLRNFSPGPSNTLM